MSKFYSFSRSKSESIFNILSDLKNSGRIFGASYVKKDGTRTMINGRFGVQKFLKGGRRTVGNDYVIIWDNNRRRYTALDPKMIVSIRYKKDILLNEDFLNLKSDLYSEMLWV